MRRIQIIIILLYFLVLYSCELFEKQKQNLPPDPFNVIVSKTYSNHALLIWEPAVDPENDSITYSVYLNDIVLVGNLRNVFHLELKDLQSSKSYSGSVIATDSKKNSTKAPFNFSTTINSAPDSFKITISKITQTNALIMWEAAKDIDDDSILYTIKINDIEVATEIKHKNSFECKNLLPGTSYNGIIIATDSKNNSKSVPFRFSTDKYCLRFSKIIAVNGYSSLTGYNIEKTSDGGYILGCTGYIPDQHYYIAVKTDSLANIQWSSAVPPNQVGMAVADVQIKQIDDGYLMLGLKSIIKLNSIGQLVWQYISPQDLTDPGYGFSSFIQTPDNGFIVIGSYFTHNTTNLIQAYISKFNKDGILQWEKMIGNSWRNYGCYIDKTNDGNYVILGTSGGDNTYFVVKIDGDGNQLWNKMYPNTQYVYHFAKQIKKTLDNAFIIAGYSWDYLHVSDARIMKIDNDGSIIWEKYFNVDYRTTMTSAIEPTNESGCTITGINGDGGSQSCFLVNLDVAGNYLWQKNFHSESVCSFQGKDLKATYDGGCTVIGAKGCIWSDDGSEHGLWIFKTDPNGNYED